MAVVCPEGSWDISVAHQQPPGSGLPSFSPSGPFSWGKEEQQSFVVWALPASRLLPLSSPPV